MGAGVQMDDVLAVAVLSASWARATLEGFVSGSWVSLGTIDRRIGGGDVAYSRHGDTVSPAGSSPVTPYLHAGLVTGGWFGYASSGAVRSRRIVEQREGRWLSTAARQAWCRLEGAADSDPASGTGGAMWPADSLHLVPLLGKRPQKIRLTIQAPGTAYHSPQSGHYETGRIVVASARILDPPSWDMTHAWEDGAEVAESRDRQRVSRAVAPPRRRVTIGWDNGLDVRRATDTADTPTANHASSSGSAVATGSDQATPYTLLDAMEDAAGADTPVIVAWDLPDLGTGVVHILDDARWIYGRAEGGLTRTSTLGGYADDVQRIPTLSIVEEV
jgi:hypothetical protein